MQAGFGLLLVSLSRLGHATPAPQAAPAPSTAPVPGTAPVPHHTAQAALRGGTRTAEAGVAREPSQVAAVPNSLRWHSAWRRSNTLDYSIIGVGFSAALVLELIPRRTSPNWQGAVLFDDPVRSTLVASSPEGRDRADTISDLGQWGSVVHTVFDATFISMWRLRAPDLGYEMLVMNAEAYAVTALLNSVTKRFIGRERPDVAGCEANPGYDSTCATNDRYASFYSGHTSLTATSAGLTCVHHVQNPLYGGPWDAVACASSIALTSFTGALRVVSDRHWASDVITGHMIGFTTGYFMPLVFHYRLVPRSRPDPNALGPAITGLIPYADQWGVRLTLFGSL